MRRSAPQAYCGSTPVIPFITDSLLHSWDTFPLFVEADSLSAPIRHPVLSNGIRRWRTRHNPG